MLTRGPCRRDPQVRLGLADVGGQIRLDPSRLAEQIEQSAEELVVGQQPDRSDALVLLLRPAGRRAGSNHRPTESVRDASRMATMILR